MVETDERLRQAIRAGNIGIFEHDHQRDTVYWSPELRAIFGWDPTEPATLAKILEQVHPDDSARVIAAVSAAHDPAGEGAFDIEHRIFDRAKRLRWVLTRSKTQFANRQPTRTIGAVQDVTERKAAEERLRLFDTLLSSSGQATLIAHDLNNLLVVILGGLDLALAEIPDELHCKKQLVAAANAAKTAGVLTRQLLPFSRKEAIAPKLIDLNAVIHSVESTLMRLLGDDIALKTVCAAGLARVRFGPAQLEQILVNLAVNARDAMVGGGHLTIETSNIRLGARLDEQRIGVRPGQYVLLEVSDNGPGMSDEVRSRVFEPFFTTKPAGKGTGLGLAMVHGAVKQHGGSIEVRSQPGRGTAFRIYVPADPRGAQGWNAADEPAHVAPPRHDAVELTRAAPSK